MQILFQTNDFVGVVKPPGVLSVPARTGDKDPRPVLGLQIQNHFAKPIFPVHRLDFEVRGIVLFAFNAKAHAAANRWFEQRLAHKTYHALSAVQPNLTKEVESAEGEVWESRLLRGKKRAYESPLGKPSTTHARYLGLGQGGNFLWELKPITGRSHQLRYEMYKRGWPLVGDQLYGSPKPWAQGAIALEAVRLELPPEAKTQFGIETSFVIASNLSCQEQNSVIKSYP